MDLTSPAHETLRAWRHADECRALIFNRSGSVTLVEHLFSHKREALFASAAEAVEALATGSVAWVVVLPPAPVATPLLRLAARRATY